MDRLSGLEADCRGALNGVDMESLFGPVKHANEPDRVTRGSPQPPTRAPVGRRGYRGVG